MLHGLPQLFQIWATKHVLGIVGTMKFLANQDYRSHLCPSCLECKETCKHISRCPDVGRTLAFKQSAQWVEAWLDKNSTHPDLQSFLLRYLRGRGTIKCYECSVDNLPHILQDFVVSQDVIGWDNFVIGMVSSKLLPIQSAYSYNSRSSSHATRWISGLIT